MWRTFTAAVVAGLALAACGSSQSTPPSSSTSAASSTSTATSSSTPSAHAQAPRPCAASQLRLSYVGTDGATGHLEVTLALRNASARACALRGYPGARLLTSRGTVLPLTVKRGGGFFADAQRRAQRVVLAPGGRARFGIGFVTNNEYAGARICRTAAAAMSSAPGAAGHWWRLSLARAPRISPCGNQLVVSPIYA